MQNNLTFKILDDEFASKMKCATLLAEKLIGKEKTTALNWMRRLMQLQTNDVGVKKDRNHFLRKLLEVMKQSLIQRFLEHSSSKQLSQLEKNKIKEEITKIEDTYKTPLLDKFLTEGKESSSYMSMWSNDRRTYVAAKPIPGRGALIYMAVSEKPELGWTIPNQ